MKAFRWITAAVVFAALMAALWAGARHSSLSNAVGIPFQRAFASFVLLLAPLWFFGFRNPPVHANEDSLRSLPRLLEVLAVGTLGIPYFVLTLGTPLFYWRAAIIVIAFPVLLAAFLETSKLSAQMTWRDGAVLAIIVAAYFFKWLHAAWPLPWEAPLPKLFLADVALYCFLVVRKLEGTGYVLIPTVSSFWIGVGEWAFYVPIAIGLGEWTGFIHFHSTVPAVGKTAASIVITFLLIALPEELFFRAILQNLLETRLGRMPALFTAAILFGLSHFNHGATFNWRYVLLAAIAGIFYGRAWRARRQVLASVVTHTLVDVVWSIWFR
jgi:membrane protease YdiL (CAAX protease family)